MIAEVTEVNNKPDINGYYTVDEMYSGTERLIIQATSISEYVT